LAGICGIFTAIGINKLRTPVAAAQSEPQTTPVVVAAADIAVGQRITAEDVEIRQCPVDFLPADAITTLEEATGTKDQPNWASTRLLKGDPLSKAKVTNIQGLQVRPGHRAYTIQCSTPAANVAGFVRAGNFVDVLCARRGTREAKADTLVCNVQILAVDQKLEPSDDPNDKVQSVTLEVTPEQTEVLAAGQSGGQLTLALRNPDEPSMEIIHREPPEPPRPPKSQPKSWIEIRGNRNTVREHQQ